MRIYLIGSLRNPAIPEIANDIEAATGHEVFADWWAASEDADDTWQRYEHTRGFTYHEALNRPTANQVFSFDRRWLDASDAGVLVMPAGKSGHLELGYLAGRGKPTFILFDGEPERWDVMYKLASAVAFSKDELFRLLKERLNAR